MDIINQNVRFLRKQKGYTQQQFADMLGIKRATLGAYEEGRARPNLEVQRELSRIFNISLDQLITKNLSKLVSKNLFKESTPASEKADGRDLRVLSITVDSEDNENIELVPAKAAAGYLNGYADPEFVQELPKFHLPMLKGGTYRAFEIQGDSMLPLQPGSIVVGEYTTDWHDIKDGHTYVVLSKHDGVVYKRVFNKLEEDKVLLRSDNPSYSPFELDVDDVLEVWKAKLFITQAGAETDVNMEKMMSMIMQLQQEVISLKGKN